MSKGSCVCSSFLFRYFSVRFNSIASVWRVRVGEWKTKLSFRRWTSSLIIFCDTPPWNNMCLPRRKRSEKWNEARWVLRKADKMCSPIFSIFTMDFFSLYDLRKSMGNIYWIRFFSTLSVFSLMRMNLLRVLRNWMNIFSIAELPFRISIYQQEGEKKRKKTYESNFHGKSTHT